MMISRTIFLLWMALLLTACSLQTTPSTPTAPAATPTATPANTPTTSQPPTAVPPTPSPPPDPTSDPRAPTLFEHAWEDTTPYQAGLRPLYHDSLDQLSHAPIYHIAITVEENDGLLNRVSGTQQLRYTNQETIPLDALYFHLFPNLLGEAISINHAAVNGQTVKHQLQEAANSILQLPLPQPLAPGEQATISLQFTTIVPQTLDRNYGVIAYYDNILALAHFYPMLAVYDASGWNTTPADEAGDVVYADTSFYLVRVTAPVDQQIAASGRELERTTTTTQQTITYAAGPVRDFYLAMSDEYVPTSQQVGDVTLNSYARPQYATASQQVLDYATAALHIFETHFTPYPYTELDIATTPTLALGVEYPGIFVNTERMYGDDERYSSYLESTTVHELAHQWFYNLIGNDQLDEPWLDEALAQYATWLYFQQQYGDAAAQAFYDSLDLRWSRLAYEEMPIGLPVSAYEGSAYSAIIYGRGPIFILQLKETMGEAAFDSFLQSYFATYQWQNSDTERFQTLAEQHCDCDLNPLFAEWIYSK